MHVLLLVILLYAADDVLRLAMLAYLICLYFFVFRNPHTRNFK